MPYLLFIVLAVFSFSCKTQQQLPVFNLSNQTKVVFLDSLTAAKAIISDEKEHFFDYIGKTDMSIQMKRTFDAGTSRATALKQYKAFLQKEVLDFTPEEISFVEGIFQRMFTNCNKLSTSIFPKEVRLIKTHANHYGSATYYTRENIIVIPKYVLAEQNEEAFYSVMLHELSHIYTRYNATKRAALYELIGFKSIGTPDILKLDQPLKDRILTNPDGINYAYAIQLRQGDHALQAIPIISATEDEYVGTKSEFFSYLHFGLYPIEGPYSRIIKVKSDENGKSKLPPKMMADFQRKITDNTGYIIHPDEIIADNFMYLVQSIEDENNLFQFSSEGQKLLEEIRKVMVE